MKKLTINRETLCSLTDQLTEQVNGGTGANCVIVIKPTILYCTPVCPRPTPTIQTITITITHTTSLPPTTVQTSEGSYAQ